MTLQLLTVELIFFMFCHALCIIVVFSGLCLALSSLCCGRESWLLYSFCVLSIITFAFLLGVIEGYVL